MNIQTAKVKELPERLQAAVVPLGLISAANLAELAGLTPQAVRARCKRCGVEGVYVRRVNVNGDYIGGRMMCYPKEAGLDAVLGEEEPYVVCRCGDQFEVRKHHMTEQVTMAIYNINAYADSNAAFRAAEAECARLNAEYRKELA